MHQSEVAPLNLTNQNNTVAISFMNLTYSVKQKNNLITQNKIILDNLSGVCYPGQVTAILGSSGAGKTSLLNILAQRIQGSKNISLLGDIHANGLPYDSEQFAKFSGYVMQNDILFGTLTVRETFEFVAKLKYTQEADQIEKINYALKSLKLEKCQHALIGNELLKGISGGERKRASIGVELVRDPDCLMLDEPTSGLDSFTAFVITNLLKQLALTSKRTIIFTIHQPSTDIYLLLDQVFLLSQGKFVYQGPRSLLIPYFKSIGFDCPQNSNPLDYLMEIMHQNDTKTSGSIQLMIQCYEKEFQEKIEKDILQIQPKKILKEGYQSSFKQQVRQILGRGIKNIKRDKILVKSRIVMSIFLGLIVGGIFWTAGSETGYKGTQSVTGALFFLVMSSFMTALNPVIVQFPIERQVFLREENSKLYSTLAYFIGKSSIEIPFLIFFPIMQQLICYWMVDLNDNAAEIVVINILVCILLGISGNSAGLMVGSMLEDGKTASGIIPVILMPLIAFSGFFANQKLFMDWIGWIQYLSPMKYAFEALIWNEFDSKSSEFQGTNQNNQNPIKTFGLEIGLWNSIYVLIAFPILFRILAYFFLYFSRTKQQ